MRAFLGLAGQLGLAPVVGFPDASGGIAPAGWSLDFSVPDNLTQLIVCCF